MTNEIRTSAWHEIIRELGKVRTRGGIIALTSFLMFLAFIFALLNTHNTERYIVAGGIFILWFIVTIYGATKLPITEDEKLHKIEVNDNDK